MPTPVLWTLELGGEVIATIRQTGYETPWTHGELLDAAKFERFRVYFGNDNDWPETPEFEELLGEIHGRGGFRVRNTSTDEVVQTALFNHDGADGVWFRHS